MSPFFSQCACPDHPAPSSRRGFLSGLTAMGLGAALSACQSPTSAQASKPHRIDIHHHIVPPTYAADLARLGGGGAPKWSVQMSLENMDQNGIATSVVALMQPGAFFSQAETDRRLARESNEYAAQMGRDHPGRFGSFADQPRVPERRGACGALARPALAGDERPSTWLAKMVFLPWLHPPHRWFAAPCPTETPLVCTATVTSAGRRRCTHHQRQRCPGRRTEWQGFIPNFPHFDPQPNGHGFARAALLLRTCVLARLAVGLGRWASTH